MLKTSLDEAKINAVRACEKTNLPVVLTKQEVKRVILAMTGTCQFMAKLLYGAVGCDLWNVSDSVCMISILT